MGLRSFLIGARYQNRGIGKSAVLGLAAYLRRCYPARPSVVLTVKHNNPNALATYSKGGFIDTGATYLGGSAGPQQILRLALFQGLSAATTISITA